jgi:hypothetical protein
MVTTEHYKIGDDGRESRIFASEVFTRKLGLLLSVQVFDHDPNV